MISVRFFFVAPVLLFILASFFGFKWDAWSMFRKKKRCYKEDNLHTQRSFGVTQNRRGRPRFTIIGQGRRKYGLTTHNFNWHEFVNCVNMLNTDLCPSASSDITLNGGNNLCSISLSYRWLATSTVCWLSCSSSLLQCSIF